MKSCYHRGMSDDGSQPKTILTGDRPTGKLHLGHLVGSLQNRVKLQEEHTQFVEIADVQALTDNADQPDKVHSGVFEVAVDNLAAGVDPARTTFFVQSVVPHIAELTVLFLNLVTLARLKRNPTVKDEMQQKGYGEDVPAGFLAYPVSQAADISIVKGNLVPVGEDQLPVLEQANEILHKFNTLYGDIFPKIEPLVSKSSRLRGIDGKEKMSKSLGNAIFLADSPDEIKRKVMEMYTDPQHVHKEDPGRVEGNVVFEYLDAFDADAHGLAELKERYRAGGVGDVEIKERLTRILVDVLEPIREKRENLEQNPDYVMNILKEGTERVRSIAEKTMEEVRRAMKIQYF